jgi:hypothetical protein
MTAKDIALTPPLLDLFLMVFGVGVSCLMHRVFKIKRRKCKEDKRRETKSTAPKHANDAVTGKNEELGRNAPLSKESIRHR